MNVQKNFRADLQLGLDQRIERVRHYAFRGILDRHHAEFRSSLTHFLKHLGDARRRTQVRRRTEFLAGSKMRIGRRSSEKCHIQRAFKRAAARNDLTKNGSNGLSGKRPAIQISDPLENFFLAVGSVDLLVALALGMANPLCQRSAIV